MTWLLRRSVVATIAMYLSGIVVAITLAQDAMPIPGALAGLKTIGLMVATYDPIAESRGIDEAYLRKTIGVTLSKAGLTVFPPNSGRLEDSMLLMQFHSAGGELATTGVTSITARFIERCTVKRSGVTKMGQFWDRTISLEAGTPTSEPEKIDKTLQRLVDEFIAEWREENAVPIKK